MEMLTAARYANFEVRICAATNINSPTTTERLTDDLIRLLNRHGAEWNRLVNATTPSPLLNFRRIHGFHFSYEIDASWSTVVPSLVNLSRIMTKYGYVIGALDRSQPRFLDLHCYPAEEEDYEFYWSAAEQTLTESDLEEFLP